MSGSVENQGPGPTLEECIEWLEDDVELPEHAGRATPHADRRAFYEKRYATTAYLRSLLAQNAALVEERDRLREAARWDRTVACAAASLASSQFGEWVPQRWLDLFMKNYEQVLRDGSPARRASDDAV